MQLRMGLYGRAIIASLLVAAVQPALVPRAASTQLEGDLRGTRALLTTSLDVGGTTWSNVSFCYDRRGRRIADGTVFVPGDDTCRKCHCTKGIAAHCTLVRCSPPNCERWEAVPDECCQFHCIDVGVVASGDTRQSVHRLGNETSVVLYGQVDVATLSIRLVASVVSSLLIFFLFLFVIQRLRQRRLFISARRLRHGQSSREQIMASTTSFEHPTVGFEFPPYTEPPPPYTTQKPSGVESPPPYEQTPPSLDAPICDQHFVDQSSQKYHHLSMCILPHIHRQRHTRRRCSGTCRRSLGGLPTMGGMCRMPEGTGVQSRVRMAEVVRLLSGRACEPTTHEFYEMNDMTKSVSSASDVPQSLTKEFTEKPIRNSYPFPSRCCHGKHRNSAAATSRAWENQYLENFPCGADVRCSRHQYKSRNFHIKNCLDNSIPSTSTEFQETNGGGSDCCSVADLCDIMQRSAPAEIISANWDAPATVKEPSKSEEDEILASGSRNSECHDNESQFNLPTIPSTADDLSRGNRLPSPDSGTLSGQSGIGMHRTASVASQISVCSETGEIKFPNRFLPNLYCSKLLAHSAYCSPPSVNHNNYHAKFGRMCYADGDMLASGESTGLCENLGDKVSTGGLGDGMALDDAYSDAVKSRNYRPHVIRPTNYHNVSNYGRDILESNEEQNDDGSFYKSHDTSEFSTSTARKHNRRRTGKKCSKKSDKHNMLVKLVDDALGHISAVKAQLNWDHPEASTWCQAERCMDIPGKCTHNAHLQHLNEYGLDNAFVLAEQVQSSRNGRQLSNGPFRVRSDDSGGECDLDIVNSNVFGQRQLHCDNDSLNLTG